jgi:molybdenum cofactor cytidylyltransferase
VNESRRLTSRPGLVVLARGASRRMGKPKGTVRVPGTDLPMLRAVIDLYPARAFRRLVVTRPELKKVYEPILAGSGPVDWVLGAGGGTTAGSLDLALGFWQAAGPAPELVFAHPVDLPLVQARTLALLLERVADPGLEAWRPTYQGRRGHPVVLRWRALCRVLEGLPGTDLMTRSMGSLLQEEEEAGRMTLVPVTDPGVVQDFDTPDDLEGSR